LPNEGDFIPPGNQCQEIKGDQTITPTRQYLQKEFEYPIIPPMSLYVLTKVIPPNRTVPPERFHRGHEKPLSVIISEIEAKMAGNDKPSKAEIDGITRRRQISYFHTGGVEKE